MPNWLICSGDAKGAVFPAGVTRWGHICGSLYADGTEAKMQHIARGTYTLSRLYVRVLANASAADSTVRSRKNIGNGNQSVTIGAGATGVFTDDVNSDGLVDGDAFNNAVVVGAGGSLTLALISYMLASPSNIPIHSSNNSTSVQTAFGVIRSSVINGEWYNLSTVWPYTVREAITFSNLRTYIQNNTLNGQTLYNLRINGVAGAQTLTIPAATTGVFEDVVNTDAVVAGNTVSTHSDSTAAGAGTIGPSAVQVKATTAGRLVIAGSSRDEQYLGGTTWFFAVEGSSQREIAAEVSSQTLARTPFTARNIFFSLWTNTLIAGSTVSLRKNGASVISVTVPALTAGVFENLVDTSDFLATDLINWIQAWGGVANNVLRPSHMGFQLDQPVALASGSVVPLAVGSGMV